MQREQQADKDAAVEAKRRVGSGVVDRQWLFNRLFIGVVVIDIRPTDAAMQNTVLGSIHIPPMANASAMGEVDMQLLSPHRENFSPSRRFLREVVLVGEPTDESRRWQQRLQELLVDEGEVAHIAIMQDGFAAFHAKYPFYTSAHQAPEQDPTSIRRVTYPNEVVDSFLYLGNMWHAKSEQIVQDLGITHIVNATLDLGNVFEGRGVQYHEVKIPDHSDADIASFFNATFAFIASVRAIQPPSTHFRVLVHCTQGISRSATLVLMYLMRANGWSLVKAFNHTHRRRPVIIPNSGFFRALLEDERRLFQGKNSLYEREIDALLQGRIDDRDATIRYSEPDCSSPTRHGASTSQPAAGRNACTLM